MLLLFAALALPFVAIVVIVSRRSWVRLAAERANDSICTFARAFPRRSVDTAVIRAVWQEMSECSRVPPRAEGLLEELFVDVDLDLDWERICARTGRTMRDYGDNPHYGRVVTIGDAVRFVSAQPLANDAA